MVVTVTQNSELSNPEYLFSFTHIFSKQNVTFIPTDISTHKNRYDEFYFVEGNGAGKIKFPYEGLYLYAIWEQPNGSGNLNPALATNVVENGEAQVLFQSGITMESNYDIWLSPNEENSNIIFAPDELSPAPTPSLTPTTTSTPNPTPSITPTNTPSVTPSVTQTSTPNVTPSVTQTNTPSITPSVTETSTPTPSVTQTNTPSVTPSETPTNTPSITPSETPTNTPSVTPSVTQTNTPSVTPSITPSVTQTNTPSVTPTNTNTPSVTQTNTPSITPSVTQTSTPTITPTLTRTPTPTTPFTPAQFTNLVEWWRSYAGVGTDAGLAVTGWTGFNGNVLTATTSTRRAQFVSSDANFGNQPSLLFNSGSTTEDWGYDRPMFSGNTDKTWLMVCRLNSKIGTSDYNVFFAPGPVQSPRTAIFARTSSNAYDCFSSVPDIETITGSTAVNNTYQFLRISYNRASGGSQFFISTGNTFQTLLTTNASNSGGNYTSGSLNVGGYKDSLGAADTPRMNVVEFIQINGIPTASELTNYSNYLNARYGI